MKHTSNHKYLPMRVSCWILIASRLCVFSDRRRKVGSHAMDLAADLPLKIWPMMWATGAWTLQDRIDRSHRSASERRSLERTQPPTPEAQLVLNELQEGEDLWLLLRRHLGPRGSLFVLRVLAEHKDWYEVKRREEDSIRQEYLAHVEACRSFDPDWVHHAMNERVEALRRNVDDDSSDDG